MSEVNERAFDWDDPVEKDSSEFVILPAGDYDFEVIDFERARYEGGSKIPPCNKAILKIRLTDGSQSTTVNYNLLLYSTLEWKISEFLVAIGQKKKGEKATPKWNNMVGCTGRCKVKIRNWKNDDGELKQSNEIEKFYEKEQRDWKSGGF